MYIKREEAGNDLIKLSMDEQLFLYKLALNVFKHDADGCEFILEDLPEFNLKVSIDFKVAKRDE